MTNPTTNGFQMLAPYNCTPLVSSKLDATLGAGLETISVGDPQVRPPTAFAARPPDHRIGHHLS
ncbi:MAG: hypothetical protein MZV65_16690 [Chromatiales bacterium]|nr:hypothetical protein [Chromatiales bacterium]